MDGIKSSKALLDTWDDISEEKGLNSCLTPFSQLSSTGRIWNLFWIEGKKTGKPETPGIICAKYKIMQCVPGEIQEMRISLHSPMAIKGENEHLTSSPSSLVFSTGFSLSLTLGLVTTLIPPTCKRTALKSLQNFESYFLSRSVAALQIADCNVAHPQWILGDLKKFCTYFGQVS